MPLSPTFILIDIFHRYFTESCKIFTAYATITDKIISLVIYRWKYRRNYFIGIFPAGIVFFFCAFSVCKTICFLLFFYWQNVELPTNAMLTDIVCRVISRNISVGKTVKCCSDVDRNSNVTKGIFDSFNRDILW